MRRKYVIRGICSTISINIRKWFLNPRIYILALISLLCMACYSFDFVDIAKEIGDGINFFALLPAVFGGVIGFPRFITLFGAVLLFCDAPFMDGNQQFLFVRLGGRLWAAGSIAYIMAASLIYVLLIQLGLAVGCLTHIGISDKWGILMEYISLSAKTKASVTQNILTEYSVMEAHAYIFFALWMSVLLIGMVIYTVNLFFIQRIGVVAGSMVVVLGGIGLYLSEKARAILFYISPINLMELWCLDNGQGRSFYPTVRYGILYYCIALIVLGALDLCLYNRVDVQIKEM